LTIAGSDPSGGAGIQADLKTFHRLEAYGEAVITLITVQNTLTVDRVEVLDAELVRQQLDAVIQDIPPGAAKTGALGSAAIVKTVAEAAASFSFPLVVDPVLFSSKGSPLLDADGRQALIELLMPRAFLLMPNLSEASDLVGFSVTDIPAMRRAAEALASRGPKNVLVKGGHLRGEAVDILFADGKIHEYAASRVATAHTHGTGCTFSAAITAELAKGTPLPDAVARAKTFITRAIQWAPGLGSGTGPLNHF
jgi:hydroxymethylpyrimidine/phosphomethylpyrimidine kinase